MQERRAKTEFQFGTEIYFELEATTLLARREVCACAFGRGGPHGEGWREEARRATPRVWRKCFPWGLPQREIGCRKQLLTYVPQCRRRSLSASLQLGGVWV